jgi:hypothetical protein
VTANDLITRSLKTIGVLAAGETANGTDVNDALTQLNNMIDTWATNRLTIYSVARTALNLSASTQTYTIGTGGTWNIARPIWITAAGVIPDSTAAAAQKTEIPIRILTVEQWRDIAIKELTSTYPQEMYYDKTWTAGLGNIEVWPIPTSSNSQVVLYTPTALVQFADLTTNYTFPPGYEEALRYQLALRLAPEFGRQLSPDVQMLAAETFANIKRTNTNEDVLSIDPALVSTGGRYDWRTDRYR